ncbi:MAG: ATP-binding protein, partial [Polyangia bacterium]
MAAAAQTLVRPPALFVGRDAEIARLQALLPRVPFALICGVAGVGKSALAYRIAADWPGRQIHRRIAAGQTLGALCDDLRRECAASDVVPEAQDDAERLADLAQRLDDAVALVVLDDLHHLTRPDSEQLVDGLARLLRRGRVIATSRETLVRHADSPDRAELRLGGIDETSERALWHALDELY